jgi:hypothetical protein
VTLREALFRRRATVQLYYEGLRRNAPLLELNEYQRAALIADRDLTEAILLRQN